MSEAPKYWPKIQQLREEEAQKIRERLLKAQEEQERRDAEEASARTQTVDIVRVTLNELKDFAPELLQYPQREVVETFEDPTGRFLRGKNSIVLRWGNKFDLTDKEKQLKERLRVKTKDISEDEVPESIVHSDYYYMGINFCINFLTIPRRGTDALHYKDIIEDPTKLLTELSNSVLHPPYRSRGTYEKGRDYWQIPPKPSRFSALRAAITRSHS